MYNLQLFDVFLTIVFIVLIISLNILITSKNLRLIINFVLVSEIIFMSFFVSKFPFFGAFFCLLVSLYFLINSLYSENKELGKSVTTYLSFISKYRLGISLLVLIGLVFFEQNTDKTLTELDFLVIAFAVIFGFNSDIVGVYKQEKSFLELFLLSLLIIQLTPTIIFELFLTNRDIGDSYDEFLTHRFLGYPLSLLLNLFGYYTHAEGHMLYFEDNQAGFLRGIIIAKDCSGLASASIFVAALVSYIYIYGSGLGVRSILIVSFGIIVSYLANLFRMFIIVIVGHYYGIDALVFTHANLGWLIFTAWVALFWFYLEKYELVRLDNDLVVSSQTEIKI